MAGLDTGRRLERALTAAVMMLVLSSCGGESPVVVWLARHGHEVRPEIAQAVSKGRVCVGMPLDAVEAVIAELGYRIIERKDIAGGDMMRLVYRIVNYDSVGKAHSAQVTVLFRDGYVMAVTLIPES